MARHGYSVRLPLLPGHGTTWKDMAGTTWERWFAVDRDAVRELRKRCDRVFVFGLSMGGTLALRLAEELGEDVAGVVLVNPSVHTEDRRAPFAKYLQYVLPSLPAIGNDIKKPGVNEHAYDRVPVKSVVQLQRLWDVVRSDIERITQPVLLCVSAEDHVVEPSNAQWLVENIGSSDLASLVMQDSYHVATLDNDAEKLFATALQFVQRLEH